MIVNKEAQLILQEMSKQCDQLKIISILGNYRTGFQVGATVNACTKGLWMWPELIKYKLNDEVHHCLIIDTEGIGSTNEEQNHDTKIFIMALLLSSQLIYNSVGAIDDSAIQNIGFIIKLSKFIENQQIDEEQIQNFPSFLWILRDFALQLVDDSGNQITPKQYLDNALKPQKGSSDLIESKNRIRRQISEFFKQKDCFPLIRPAKNENELQNLSQLDDSQLRPDFLQQVAILRNKIQ